MNTEANCGTVLVTGAGQIGSLTAALLRDRGERVVLVDVREPSPEVMAFARIPDIAFRRVDVTDFGALDALCESESVERVVHTAALLSTAIRAAPLKGVQVNALGTANLLELARRRGLKRLVFASSTMLTYAVFGTFLGTAIPEDFSMRALSEGPGSVYSASKLFSEHLARLYRLLHGVSSVALRYAAVIGPWPGPVTSVPGRMLEALITPAREGRPARLDDPFLVWEGIEEFVDARDCAAANVAALDAVDPALGVYHIASGETFTLDEVIDAVRSAFPSIEVTERAAARGGFSGFPHHRPAPSDISAAKRELGFSPRWKLADSIRDMAAAARGPT